MPRPDRKPSPLTATRLQDLALSYVARFATTRAKLEAYLVRKLRERGWEGDDPPTPPPWRTGSPKRAMSTMRSMRE